VAAQHGGDGVKKKKLKPETLGNRKIVVRNGARALANRKSQIQKPKAALSMLPPGNPNYRKWRDQFNPLRGLTIKRAVTLLEQSQRGIMAEYQWTCRLMERRFAELSALISRRVSALMEMDWEIKTVTPEEGDPEADAKVKLADAQAARLREAYEGISNLYEGMEALAMATFRGYGFCEKIVNPDGDIVELRPVACWNLVKDGTAPRWKYNPEANNCLFESILGDELPLSRFVWREIERPLNELALVLFLRANNANKNWDAFLEIYGVPGGVVILPSGVPPEKETEYQEAAKEIALGGSGSLPSGSDYKANDGPRGTNPFSDYLKHVSEMLVLAGTGGKLSMLNDATGIGGSQGDVHADAFRQIAAADARDISEIFQRQIDTPILDAEFAGQERLAYFELNFREEVKAGEVVETVSKLALAGLLADAEEIGEKVGLKLTRQAEARVQSSLATGKDAGSSATQDARPPELKEEKSPVANRAEGMKTVPSLEAALDAIFADIADKTEAAMAEELTLATGKDAGSSHTLEARAPEEAKP
jgi:phage gp29-like protein